MLSSSQDAKDGSYNTSITTTVEGLKYTNRINTRQDCGDDFKSSSR